VFGFHKHRDRSAHADAQQQEEQVDPIAAQAAEAAGPIPEVATEPSASGGDHASASERAYDRPEDYKGKNWANRGFDQLSDEQRQLIDSVSPGEGEQVWGHVPAALRAGFLNITAVMKANGFPLAGLRLQPSRQDLKHSGLQQDRLLFTPESASILRAPLEAAIQERDQRGDRGFIADKPEERLHPGMGEWGGRQWVTRFSMQIGGGSGGAFVDIDEFGPKVDVVGTLGHGFEVLRNKLGHHTTDPFAVARGLHKRGDEP